VLYPERTGYWSPGLQLARQGSNADYGVLYIGQTSGLINSIQPAGEIVTGMVREAKAILGQHIPRLLAGGQGKGI
jgi:NAD(P)H-dependent flavin oxidoreductase YrpB (nitropropane dioxygenase family)